MDELLRIANQCLDEFQELHSREAFAKKVDMVGQEKCANDSLYSLDQTSYESLTGDSYSKKSALSTVKESKGCLSRPWLRVSQEMYQWPSSQLKEGH